MRKTYSQEFNHLHIDLFETKTRLERIKKQKETIGIAYDDQGLSFWWHGNDTRVRAAGKKQDMQECVVGTWCHAIPTL